MQPAALGVALLAALPFVALIVWADRRAGIKFLSPGVPDLPSTIASIAIVGGFVATLLLCMVAIALLGIPLEGAAFDLAFGVTVGITTTAPVAGYHLYITRGLWALRRRSPRSTPFRAPLRPSPSSPRALRDGGYSSTLRPLGRPCPRDSSRGS